MGGRETRHTFSLNQVLFLLFEHDPEYGLSFKKIIDLLKPGGLFCFTYASTGRDEHGTLRTTPREIGGVKGFGDYYKNQSMLEGGEGKVHWPGTDDMYLHACIVVLVCRDLAKIHLRAWRLMIVSRPTLVPKCQRAPKRVSRAGA